MRVRRDEELDGDDAGALVQQLEEGMQFEGLPPGSVTEGMPRDTVYAVTDVELRDPETDEVVRTLPVGAQWEVRDGRVVAWAAALPDRSSCL